MSIRDKDLVHFFIKYLLAVTSICLIVYICFITVEFLNYEASPVADKYELKECKSYD